MSERETILERCRKLLALAKDKAASPAEAEAAAALMASLLTRHSLSLADVEKGTYGEGFEAADVVLPYRKLPRWVANLACRVSGPLDCRVLSHHVLRPGRPLALAASFVGRVSDAQVAAYLFAWLHGLLPKAAAAHRVPRRHPARWRESFLLAAAGAIEQRMLAEKRQAARAAEEAAQAEEKAAASGHGHALPLFERAAERMGAIVAVKTAGLDGFIAQRFPRIGKERKVSVEVPELDLDGLFAGRRYGSELPLRKGISQNAS